jgi:hypothetical protein
MAFLSFALLIYSALPFYYPTFTTWSNFYNRTYLSATERDYRESVYTYNLVKIARYNNNSNSWVLDINNFTDLTLKEYLAEYRKIF